MSLPASPIKHETNILNLPTCKMSYNKCGAGHTAFLLIHGGDRTYQTKEHWNRHLDFFAQRGVVYAVSLPGHGNESQNYCLQLHVEALCELIKRETEIQNCNSLILVGRSYGGRVIMSLIEKLQQSNKQNALHRMILIAPAISMSNVPKDVVATINTLFCWAIGDPIVPFANYENLKTVFTIQKLIEFDFPICSTKPFLQHMPENVEVEKFQKEVDEWLKDKNL